MTSIISPINKMPAFVEHKIAKYQKSPDCQYHDFAKRVDFTNTIHIPTPTWQPPHNIVSRAIPGLSFFNGLDGTEDGIQWSEWYSSRKKIIPITSPVSHLWMEINGLCIEAWCQDKLIWHMETSSINNIHHHLLPLPMFPDQLKTGKWELRIISNVNDEKNQLILNHPYKYKLGYHPQIKPHQSYLFEETLDTNWNVYSNSSLGVSHIKVLSGKGISEMDCTSETKNHEYAENEVYTMSNNMIYYTKINPIKNKMGYSIGYIYNMLSFHDGAASLLKPCHSICRMQELADSWKINHRSDNLKSVYRENRIKYKEKVYFNHKLKKNFFQAWKYKISRQIKKEIFQTWKRLLIQKCNMCPTAFQGTLTPHNINFTHYSLRYQNPMNKKDACQICLALTHIQDLQKVGVGKYLLQLKGDQKDYLKKKISNFYFILEKQDDKYLLTVNHPTYHYTLCQENIDEVYEISDIFDYRKTKVTQRGNFTTRKKNKENNSNYDTNYQKKEISEKKGEKISIINIDDNIESTPSVKIDKRWKETDYFYGYKVALMDKTKEQQCLIVLKIPKKAKLGNTKGDNKFRAQKVLVDQILPLVRSGNTMQVMRRNLTKAYSAHDRKFVYQVGMICQVKNFPSLHSSCGPGIHFCLNPQECVRYFCRKDLNKQDFYPMEYHSQAIELILSFLN